MKAKEISEKQVSAVNVFAAEMALDRCCNKLQYDGPVKVRWFVPEHDPAFARTRGTTFDAFNEYAFLPVQDGTPEIWLRASMEAETVAWLVFHEMSHVPDLKEVLERERSAKARGLKPNDDHWATWLWRESVRESEKKAELFQRAHESEANLIGQLARRSISA